MIFMRAHMLLLAMGQQLIRQSFVSSGGVAVAASLVVAEEEAALFKKVPYSLFEIMI